MILFIIQISEYEKSVGKDKFNNSFDGEWKIRIYKFF